MESVELMAAMHDLAHDSERPAPPEKPWNPGALPSTADLVARTAINGVLHPLRAGKVLIPERSWRAASHRGVAGQDCRRSSGRTGPGSGSLFAPSTRFNGAPTPQSAFEARFHDLADFKRIKACVPTRPSTT